MGVVVFIGKQPPLSIENQSYVTQTEEELFGSFGSPVRLRFMGTASATGRTANGSE